MKSLQMTESYILKYSIINLKTIKWKKFSNIKKVGILPTDSTKRFVMINYKINILN